jgi:ABC-type Fe3+-hydroxamate transport system substrate-binding protein
MHAMNLAGYLGRPSRAIAGAVMVAVVAAACSGGATPSPIPTAAATPTAAPTEGPTATPAFPMTIDAGYGAVTLDAAPQRIYAWGFQPIDEMAVLGVEPVGFSSRGSKLPPFLNLTWTAQALGEPPSLEEVVALEPDFIISDNSNDNTAVEAVGVPIFKIRANSVKDAFDQLALIGQIVGKEDVAAQFTADFNAELADTQAKIGAQPAVKTMIVYPGAEPGILGMWLDNSFIGTLVSSLGADYGLKQAELSSTDLEGTNADRATSLGLVQLGLEKLVQVNPDVLFVLGTQDFVDSLAANPAWASLNAVKDNRVSLFDRDLWSRDRGPSAAKIVIEQARYALYPDIFPAP